MRAVATLSAVLLLAFGPATGQEASWQRTGTGGGLQLDPTRHVDDPLTRALGEALGGLAGTIHNEAGARRALTVLAALGPAAESLPAGLEAQGRAYHVLGEFVLAERTYERWLTVAPADHTARTRMAVYLEQARNRREPMAPGETFRDCPDCPEMVVIPAGSFTMGSPAGEAHRGADEGPQRQVTIARAFAVGKYEVTFEQWDACVSGGGCGGYRPSDNGWGRGNRPAINVSWKNAKQYVEWLGRKTGKSYLLLSEAEWEYAARAGTTTPFHTGATITTDQANYDGNHVYANGPKGIYRGRTVEVGRFAANAFGLHDMLGNVWEYVLEPLKPGTYDPVVRGGAWNTPAEELKYATRQPILPDRKSTRLNSSHT